MEKRRKGRAARLRRLRRENRRFPNRLEGIRPRMSAFIAKRGQLYLRRFLLNMRNVKVRNLLVCEALLAKTRKRICASALYTHLLEDSRPRSLHFFIRSELALA
jgi:hypothetical protein